MGEEMWEELKNLINEAKLPFELSIKSYYESIYGGLQKGYPDCEIRMLTGYYEGALTQIVNALSELLTKSVFFFNFRNKIRKKVVWI